MNQCAVSWRTGTRPLWSSSHPICVNAMKLIPGGTDASDRPNAIPAKFSPMPNVRTTVCARGVPSVARTHRPSSALPANDIARTGQCWAG